MKSKLREEFRQSRKAIAGKAEKSQCICQHLAQSKFFQKAQSVLFFAGIAGEPNLLPLLKKNLGVKNCLLPFCNQSSFCAKRVNTLQDLQRGRFGILAPGSHCRDFAKGRIDLALTPAVCVDLQGNRIGMGGGFFDRFFVGFAGVKVAVVFAGQICQDVPCESHDVGVDFLCTENGLVAVRS